MPATLSQLDALRTALQAFGNWPPTVALSGSDDCPPGGPIDETHPLFHSVGVHIATLPENHSARLDWKDVKQYSIICEWDSDDLPIGQYADVLRSMARTFRTGLFEQIEKISGRTDSYSRPRSPGGKGGWREIIGKSRGVPDIGETTWKRIRNDLNDREFMHPDNTRKNVRIHVDGLKYLGISEDDW